MHLVAPHVDRIQVRSDGHWRIPPALDTLDLPLHLDRWMPVFGPLTEMVTRALLTTKSSLSIHSSSSSSNGVFQACQYSGTLSVSSSQSPLQISPSASQSLAQLGPMQPLPNLASAGALAHAGHQQTQSVVAPPLNSVAGPPQPAAGPGQLRAGVAWTGNLSGIRTPIQQQQQTSHSIPHSYAPMPPGSVGSHQLPYPPSSLQSGQPTHPPPPSSTAYRRQQSPMPPPVLSTNSGIMCSGQSTRLTSPSPPYSLVSPVSGPQPALDGFVSVTYPASSATTSSVSSASIMTTAGTPIYSVQGQLIPPWQQQQPTAITQLVDNFVSGPANWQTLSRPSSQPGKC
ncbi:unnamed protein product [Protopolystoma xenopodis]|uniref:Uncharacterized protein n=1 Tax=Protopolystoma xenopodis TaxID=117903 RepID=A0A448WDN5_9PLAT|nr:unnamed protein product [Protopolystoma xenopodis]